MFLLCIFLKIVKYINLFLLHLDFESQSESFFYFWGYGRIKEEFTCLKNHLYNSYFKTDIIMISLEFMLMDSIKSGSNFINFQMAIQLSQQHILKSPSLPLHFDRDLYRHWFPPMVRPLSDLLFCFIGLCICAPQPHCFSYRDFVVGFNISFIPPSQLFLYIIFLS